MVKSVLIVKKMSLCLWSNSLIQHFVSFRLFSSAAVVNKLISLGIVSTLEKSMESYSNNHDVMYAASLTCFRLAAYGR